MEGLVEAALESLRATVASCLATDVYKDECIVLGRHCAKLGLLLTELQLCFRQTEALRGSKTVFQCLDATVGALRQAEQLVAQCAGTNPSSIWPLEDAVEFQAVAAELHSAAAGLAALGGRLPADVQQDASHVYRQLALLSFTEDELSETEEQELERVQQQNSSIASPHHPSAAAAAAPAAASPTTEAEAAPSEALGPPPAAPAKQFTSPPAALDNAAVAISQHAAAQAGALPTPVAAMAAAEDQQQRQALQSAAAVATETAAEVLGSDEVEEAAPAAKEAVEGEGQQLMLEEIELEASEAAAARQAVVLTTGGETALPPMVPAKGAVPARGPSPLPPDPFDMTSAEHGGLGVGTLKELQVFQRGQEDLAVADEAQRQLEASADNLSLKEQQEGAAAAAGTNQQGQVLVALRQLQEYESAMGAGEAAESAEAAEEGRARLEEVQEEGLGQGLGQEQSEGREAEPPAHMHKSRSEKMAAELLKNLEELAATEGTEGMEGAEGGGGAAPVAAEE